jgi:hypothetical protein
MKPNSRLRNLLLEGRSVRLFMLITLLACTSAQTALSQKPEPGKWIPLPYFRSGSWWLPLDVEKPVKLMDVKKPSNRNASVVALSGMNSYVLRDASKNETLVRYDANDSAAPIKETARGSFHPFDATHYTFRGEDNLFRIMRDDGYLLPNIPMNFEELMRLKSSAKWKPSLRRSDIANQTGNNGVISSNSQLPVLPMAISYNVKLGILCVVQEDKSEAGGGWSELRIWDARSRNCLWTHRLPNWPAQPVAVQLLDNGLVFVSCSDGRGTVCHLQIYDAVNGTEVLSRKVEVGGRMHKPGKMRMAPLADGRHLLAVPSLLPESAQTKSPDIDRGLRLFDRVEETERTMLPNHQVSAILPIENTDAALVGTMKGEVLQLNLANGTYKVMDSIQDQVITALAVSENGSVWAAGTNAGTVMRGMIGQPSNTEISDLDGEVTDIAFLHGSDPRLAIRLAGDGNGFFQHYWVSKQQPPSNGLIWNPNTGEQDTLPPGTGLCVLGPDLLAIGLSDGSGVAFHDVSTGATAESLGIKSPFMIRFQDPSFFRCNADGSQIFIRDKLFDFKSLRFESLDAARKLADQVAESDLMRMRPPYTVWGSAQSPGFQGPIEQGGREIETDKGLDVLLLGPSKMPARVLLYTDEIASGARSGISPSGRVAAICTLNYLRLVDLERVRVMSQPNQGSLTEDLLNMYHFEWLKPLDDDGRRLLVIRSDIGSVEMLDYAGGRTLSRSVFGGKFLGACCAVESKRLFIATEDNCIHCVTWDHAGGLHPVGKLNLGQKDTWVLTLPNGMFMANGAEGLMALNNEGRALPLDTAAAVFHRPHEVAKAFGANPDQIALLERAYHRRCARDGLTPPAEGEANLDILPKAIIRDRLRLPLASHKSTFQFTVEATSKQSPLAKILVSVNGVPLHSWQPALPENLMSWSGDVPLILSPGANKIQVSAVDSAGRESLRETVVIWHITPPVPPTLHVVAVGVSNYHDNRLDLGAAAKDAHDLVQLLSERKGKDYLEVRSLVLTNQQAIRESIMQAREFLQGSQVGDQAVVFVAGHGFVDRDGLRYWFGTHDIDVDAVEKRGISYLELESLFDGVPARNRLLLMDTCFAGEVDVESSISQTLAANVKSRAPALASALRKPPDGSFDLMRELFGDLRRHTGATVITASSGMEHVYAEEREEGDNGVFTYCLLDAIRSGSADTNDDGEIRLSEIQAHLLARVPEMTGGRQQPTGRHVNADADFSFGRIQTRPTLDAANFVRQFLELTSANRKAKNLAVLFTEPAEYFGKTKTRSQIEQEEAKHHLRFPRRNFRLKEAEPEMIHATDSSRTLSYSMYYDMWDTEVPSSHVPTRSGSQKISMELILQNDGWKISTIKVLKSEDTSPLVRTAANVSSAPPPASQQGTLQGAVAKFLERSSANGQEQQFAAMLADTVEYFGSRKTRGQILEEELEYHRLWPYRQLSLVGDPEQVNLDNGEILARYTMSIWKSKTTDGGETIQLDMEMRLRQINSSWFITGLKVRKP